MSLQQALLFGEIIISKFLLIYLYRVFFCGIKFINVLLLLLLSIINKFLCYILIYNKYLTDDLCFFHLVFCIFITYFFKLVTIYTSIYCYNFNFSNKYTRKINNN